MSRMGNPAGETGGPGAEPMREKAQQVGQNIREMGEMAREAAKNRFEQVRQSATEYYETGKEKAMEYKENLEDVIRDKPIRAVMIAAGVGVLLGMLMRRR